MLFRRFLCPARYASRGFRSACWNLCSQGAHGAVLIQIESCGKALSPSWGLKGGSVMAGKCDTGRRNRRQRRHVTEGSVGRLRSRTLPGVSGALEGHEPSSGACAACVLPRSLTVMWRAELGRDRERCRETEVQRERRGQNQNTELSRTPGLFG